MKGTGFAFGNRFFRIPHVLFVLFFVIHFFPDRAKNPHPLYEGDTHDIGKNLVKIMLESSGYEITDLGRDVPPQTFVDKAVETGAELILLSSLMTTTMDNMEEVVRILERAGIRDRFKVAVGGGPISQAFADRIGADGYSKNANDAVRLCNELLAGT